MALQWALLTDDSFQEANTTLGATLPGPPVFVAPSTGGAYLDRVGSQWQVQSNVLIPVGVGSNNTAYTSSFLNRPSAESTLNARADAVVNLGGNILSAPVVILRNNNGACYMLAFNITNGNGTLILATLGSYGGTWTVLSQISFNNASTSTDYVLSLSAVGASPTTLNGSISTVATANNPSQLIQAIYKTDSTSGLQVSGVSAISANNSSTNIKRYTTYTLVGTVPPSIGNFSTTETENGVSIGVTSGLSGGSGTGYGYQIHRGSDPNFVASSNTLIANVSTMPYLDTNVSDGTQYYYTVIGFDSTGNTIAAAPVGITLVGGVPNLNTPAKKISKPLAIVFVGDSITYGFQVTNGGTVNSPTVPYYMMYRLRYLLGKRNITGSNNGSNGTTTTDWAPGGSLYNGALQASNSSSSANTLLNATPNAQLVVNIMLGTNDSASYGSNNGGLNRALTPDEYRTKLSAIVKQILTVDFQNALVVIHGIKYFTPNTANAFDTYSQAALSLIQQYTAQIPLVAASYPGKCFLGDTYAFDWFAQEYINELQAETGPNGTFYLHPSGAVQGGRIGTQTLGDFWANGFVSALGLPSGTRYPSISPIASIASGNTSVIVPWYIPDHGVPGSVSTGQPGTTSFKVSTNGGAAKELCNLLDRMVSDGRAVIS